MLTKDSRSIILPRTSVQYKIASSAPAFASTPDFGFAVHLIDRMTLVLPRDSPLAMFVDRALALSLLFFPLAASSGVSGVLDSKPWRKGHQPSKGEIISVAESGNVQALNDFLHRKPRLNEEIKAELFTRAAAKGYNSFIDVLLDEFIWPDEKTVHKAFCEAAEKGHAQTAYCIMSRAAIKCKKVIAQALHAAALGDHLSVVEILLTRGPSICNFDKDTTLILTAKQGNIKTFSHLFKNTLEVTFSADAKDVSLIMAASGGHKEIVKLLTSGCPSFSQYAKYESISEAGINGHNEVASYLAEIFGPQTAGTIIIKEILLNAANAGNAATVAYLMEKDARLAVGSCAIDKNITWQCREQGLVGAASQGHIDVVRVILSKVFMMSESAFQDAYNGAGSAGHTKIMDCLLAEFLGISEPTDK